METLIAVSGVLKCLANSKKRISAELSDIEKWLLECNPIPIKQITKICTKTKRAVLIKMATDFVKK